MEIKYIIYIAIALLLGVILGFLLNRKKSDNDKTQLEPEDKELDESVIEPLRSTADRLETENKELKQKLSEALASRTTDLSSDVEDRIRVIESKYKALLEEANQQCLQLDQQLKDAVRGEASIPPAQEQTALVAELKKKISKLEDDLEDFEDEIEDLKKDLSKSKDKVTSKEQENEKLNKELEKCKKEGEELEEKLSSVRDSLAEIGRASCRDRV